MNLLCLMNEKTLEEIDYFRIRDEIAAFCLSEEGKYYLLTRLPFTDYKKLIFTKTAAGSGLFIFPHAKTFLFQPGKAFII